MKFEKFLKGCGTHGQILTRKNGDRWLICGGVGMKVPNGVVNLLGSGEVGEKNRENSRHYARYGGRCSFFG